MVKGPGSLRRVRKLRAYLMPLCCIACATSPLFVPGTGEFLGTITHEGIEYEYEYQGVDSVIRSSQGGGFRINSAGNMDVIQGTDGGSLKFIFNSNNTITVDFNTPELGTGQVVVTPTTTARVKQPPSPTREKHAADHTNGADKCADLLDMCENVSFFLEVVFPSIRTELIDLITLQSKVEYPDLPEFAVSTIVSTTIDSYVNQTLEFCAGVQLIEAAGAPPCDGGSSDPVGNSPNPPAGTAQAQVSVAASSLLAGTNETISFTATVTGGTPPYTHWWQIASEGVWMQSTNNFSHTFNLQQPQTETVYCQIRDAAGVLSNLSSTLIEGREADDACPEIWGRYNTSIGYVKFYHFGDADDPAIGYYGPVVGGKDEIEGSFNALLTQGAPGCPDCSVLTGNWSKTAGTSPDDRGCIEFTFQPDRKSFIGKWSRGAGYDCNPNPSGWEADFWSGQRTNCE